MTVKKNWLEWSVFAVGLALVLAVVGYLVVQAALHEDRPPALSVRVGEPWQPPGVVPPHFIVPVTVTNHGDHVAEWVLVEVTLVRDGKPLERGELRISDVPRRSSRSGAWTLQRAPQPDELRARVLGYSEP